MSHKWTQMDTNEDGLGFNTIAKTVIGAAYEVSNVLGPGFLEKVYERAMLRELRLRDINVQSQVCYPVLYKGEEIGCYIADLVAGNEVGVELKCVDQFSSDHTALCINYLKVSKLRLALLINFQKPKVEWKRIIYG